MSKRVIYVDLSEEGIDYALKELEKFKKDFITACNELIKQLTALGIDTAQSVLTFTTNGWTGDLEKSIYQYDKKWDAENRIGRVHAETPYAAYVEFGTGIKGAEGEQSEFPHPGYVPDGQGRGEDGWLYYNKREGWRHWTWGEPAKPYMYAAYARVRDNAGRYTATIFSKL